MIRAVTEVQPAFLEFLQAENVFAAYIFTRYETFGQDMRRVCFWKQESGEMVRGAASLNDGELILCGEFDPEELCAFVRMSGCRRVLGPYRLLSALSEYLDRGLTAQAVLRFPPELPLPPQKDLLQPPLQEVFPLLCQIFEELQGTPFDLWYSGVSHKLRHGLAVVAGKWADGQLVSTAGIYNANRNVEVLGAVATLPEYRGRGFAGELLLALAAGARSRGKLPYIVSKNQQARRLYEKLGFAFQGQCCALNL